MPIPLLDEHGLLPVGVHDCTLDEIKVHFGSFQRSDRRPQLFARLDAFLSEVRASRLAKSVLVDGSFVTAQPEPNDVDLALVLPIGHDVAADLPPAQYNLVSKRRVQRRYGFDTVAVREDTLEYDQAVAFYQQVRGQPAMRKGILRLPL